MKSFFKYFLTEASNGFYGAVDKVSTNKWTEQYLSDGLRFDLRVLFIPDHGLVSFDTQLLHKKALLKMYSDGNKYGLKIDSVIPAGYATMVIDQNKKKEYIVNLNHSYIIEQSYDKANISPGFDNSVNFPTNQRSLFKSSSFALRSDVTFDFSKTSVSGATKGYSLAYTWALEQLGF